MDDFKLAGTDEFLEEVISLVEEELNVSEIEKDLFCFTSLDIKVVDDGIEVSMDDYADSLKDIKEIRKTEDRNELLTKLEMKEYCKITGKIACLTNSIRLDLCFKALQMSKKDKEQLFLIIEM